MALGVGFALALAACGAERGPEPASVPPRTAKPQAPAEYAWATHTLSPRPADPPSADLGALCVRSDAALVRVATRVATRELGGHPLDVTELTFALRAEGVPYVWPRLYTLVGPSAAASASERLTTWLSGVTEGGELRCGIVQSRSGTAGPGDVVAGVAASVLADLEPLPTRVRIGEWLRVRARLLVPASEASVLVLGPRGAPRKVPSSLSGELVDARFVADREGDWLVQVLATVAGGPRPIAEAALSAGTEPPSSFASQPAPGEAGATGDDPAARLLSMTNAARSTEGLSPVTRVESLDKMAHTHALAMRDTRRLAHDVGNGGPLDRAAAIGIAPRALGENVAHALDAERAHRMLWSSLSHRANLLREAFDSVGIGAVVDADGSLWVSLVFADLA